MTTIEAMTDDRLLRRYFQGDVREGERAERLAFTSDNIYDAATGWYLVFRYDGCHILSMGRPNLEVGQANLLRTRALVAAREMHVPLLPVSIQAYGQSKVPGHEWQTPVVVEVNDEFEAVFTVKDRYYLSGYDSQESPPLYFLCRLPGAVGSIVAARESLKPGSVKAALAAGIKVVRQGDIFAIESDEDKKSLNKIGAQFSDSSVWPIYGTAHTATELAILPTGVMLAKGALLHRPPIRGETRHPDHEARPLGKKGWWWLTRNTVPTR